MVNKRIGGMKRLLPTIPSIDFNISSTLEFVLVTFLSVWKMYLLSFLWTMLFRR